jgi:hypothetical protein
MRDKDKAIMRAYTSRQSKTNAQTCRIDMYTLQSLYLRVVTQHFLLSS